MPVVRDGVYPTLITPYRNGAPDLPAYRRTVLRAAEAGCQGVFAVCQSSESFFLTLPERLSLGRATRGAVGESGLPVSVVASGHVADDPMQQADELLAMADTGPDALVLVTNRFDIGNTSDENWIRDAERLLGRLPEGMPLGLYEMPYPYKRLLTPAMLRWIASTGRFGFIKDTCCDEALIERRLRLLEGSGVGLFNANAQTLLPSLKAGAAGYCGVMANFHPALYVRLFRIWRDHPEAAERLHDFLSIAAFTESLRYPITAKYHMTLCGIDMELACRSRSESDFTEYDRLCVRQLRRLSCALENEPSP